MKLTRKRIKLTPKFKLQAPPAARMNYSSVDISGSWYTALEATQGQIDDFLSQLPYECHQNRVAYVGD